MFSPYEEADLQTQEAVSPQEGAVSGKTGTFKQCDTSSHYIQLYLEILNLGE